MYLCHLLNQTDAKLIINKRPLGKLNFSVLQVISFSCFEFSSAHFNIGLCPFLVVISMVWFYYSQSIFVLLSMGTTLTVLSKVNNNKVWNWD